MNFTKKKIPEKRNINGEKFNIKVGLLINANKKIFKKKPSNIYLFQ